MQLILDPQIFNLEKLGERLHEKLLKSIDSSDLQFVIKTIHLPKKNKYSLRFDDVTILHLQFTKDQKLFQIKYAAKNSGDGFEELLLVKITDSQGNIFSFSYDSLGRRTALSDPDLGNWSYVYDLAGNLIQQIQNGGGNLISGDGYYREYDSLNQLIRIRNGSSASSPIIENYTYDPFGMRVKIERNDSANTKITQYSYNDLNSRLTQIKTDTIQELNYSYDSVGNVILINDTANNRTYRMAYDYLDRLVNVSIAGNTWLYSYNSIGNILKIVRDSINTTKFVYGNYPVHAPSQVITVDAGIDVHKQENLYSVDRNRTIGFYLANEKNSTITNVNWTVDFGDGLYANSTIAFSIPNNESVLVIVENNYTSGGNYKINITARSNTNSYDFENVTNKFGMTIKSLNFINQDGNKANFNITINNDLNFTVSNVNWACDNGAQSNASFSISGLSNRIDYLNRTYSSPGTKYLNCNVTSPEGNDTKFVKFDLSGIKIEDYNSSSVAENNKNVQFAIKNYWTPVAVNWNIRSDGQLFSDTTATLATNGSTAISQSINYTTDDSKIVNATIISGGMSDVYNESFSLSAIRIENLESYKNNETNQRILRFNITNYWPHTISNINWRISDPLTTSNNSITLAPRESTNFTVQINYSSQGVKSPGLLAYNGTFNSSASDRFAVRMVQILNNLVLKENKDGTIQIAEIINNMGSQIMSWMINSGQQTIYSTQNVSLNNSEQVFVIIETNYTASNVYLPNVTVNSTSYNDTHSGIVVA